MILQSFCKQFFDFDITLVSEDGAHREYRIGQYIQAQFNNGILTSWCTIKSKEEGNPFTLLKILNKIRKTTGVQ